MLLSKSRGLAVSLVKTLLPSPKTLLIPTARSMATEERKISVQGIGINYVEVGKGEHPVLLLPGAVGSIWTDFKPQIENLDRDKLKIVAWDPPGYGKSRPPDRSYSKDFFKKDAAMANEFMKAVGYNSFSLIGWSDGGITSLLLAAMHPESVRKLIVVGANAYVMPEELKTYQSIRNIDTWSKRMKDPLIEVYGEEYFKKTWSSWVDAMTSICEDEKSRGDICKDYLPKIKCPTLIVHGAKDVMVHKDHPQYLKNHITGAKLHIFEKGAHNMHLRYHEEFNKLATDFLVEK